MGISIERRYNDEMRWTELWASCSCGWKNGSPVSMVTDLAAKGFDVDGEEARQLDRVRAHHVCQEQR